MIPLFTLSLWERVGGEEKMSPLPSHILPKQQNTIAVLELAIQAVTDAQDGAIDHDLDVLPKLAGRWIPECTL